MTLDDAVRIVLASASLLLGLLVLRVIVLRIIRRGSERERQPLVSAMTSYAAFVALAVYSAFTRFGEDLDPVRTGLGLLAVTSGVWASIKMLEFKRREKARRR